MALVRTRRMFTSRSPYRVSVVHLRLCRRRSPNSLAVDLFGKIVPKSQKPPILNISIKRAYFCAQPSFLFFFFVFCFLFLHQSTAEWEQANGKISKPQHQKIYCAKHRQQQNVTRIDLAFLFIEIHRHHLLSFHRCARQLIGVVRRRLPTFDKNANMNPFEWERIQPKDWWNRLRENKIKYKRAADTWQMRDASNAHTHSTHSHPQTVSRWDKQHKYV